MPKVRLDKLLVERGLADTRTRAQGLILAGEVVVGDHAIDKPGTLVDVDAPLRLKGGPVNPYVSRGGLKLRAALDAFPIAVADAVCLDVGASTGGFTDCLLQAGARRVYALDVGYGQLAWKLANDPRVVVMDRQNIRKLEPEQIPEPIDLAVADCAFVSLTKVLPHLPALLRSGADVVALVKPQFEVGREIADKFKGVIRDERARSDAFEAVKGFALAALPGARQVGEMESPITGGDGNVEYLLGLTRDGG